MEQDNLPSYQSILISEATKRFTDVLLSIRTADPTDIEAITSYFYDPDNFTIDMLILGELKDSILKINLPDVIHMDFDLCILLRRAILHKKFKLVRLLLDNGIPLRTLEPKIMIMLAMQLGKCDVADGLIEPSEITISCAPSSRRENSRSYAQCDIDSVSKLVYKLIELKAPVHPDNYACVYMYAEIGRLDIIDRILTTYTFTNDQMTELVGRICVVAVKRDYAHVLKHFMTPVVLESIPDLAYEYLINGIKFGDCVKVATYLMENGVAVQQNDYAAVRLAKELRRENLIKYFDSLDLCY